MLDDILECIRWQLAHASAGCVTLTREHGEHLLTQFAEREEFNKLRLRVNGAVFEENDERQRLG